VIICCTQFKYSFSSDTYIEREPKESANDRNDRAIRKATQWYQNHLSKSAKESQRTKITVVLLTDDAENRRKAKEEGLLAFSVEQYVKSLTETPYLQDKLCIKEYTSESDKNPVYPPHLTVVQLHEGIKSGRLYQGAFVASRENFLEGSVNVECFEKFVSEIALICRTLSNHSLSSKVLVQGREALNRAIDGDTVCVELLPENEWSSPSEIVLEDDDDSDPTSEDAEDSENEKLLRELASHKQEKQPTGKIVGIIKRKWRQYCGILKPNESNSSRHIFIPAERKIPRVRIETRQAEKLYSQRIIVAIDQWARHSRYPQGHFVRALGPLGDKETENEVLLIEHDVPHSKFSQEVLNCLPSLPWIITEQVRY
jgi:exosome complex exonuclease DIS3/RRP44